MPVDPILLNTIWTNLSSHIPLSALDDESPHARCLDGTRTQLLSDIMNHLNQEGRSVVWLHGRPGSGKTAVALTLAEKLRADSPDRLAGCFFFPRKDTQRQSLNYVLPTVAYQIGAKHAVAREMLGSILLQDPGLLVKDRFYAHQFEPLFVYPLRVIGARLTGPKRRPPVLIFDGLDRCCSPKEYSTVLHFIKLLVNSLAGLVLDHMSNLNFHIIITTRSHFSAETILQALDKSLVIDIEKYHAGPDISFFLKERLQEIALRRCVQGPLGAPWPSEEDIEQITSKANGDFGYAERVVRFVDDIEPTRQLASVLEQCNVTTESDTQGEHRKRPRMETMSSFRSNSGNSEQWSVLGSVVSP